MNYVILLDHVVVSGSRFLLSILIARVLGLEDFGVYSLLWTIATLASAIQIPISITPMMQIGPSIANQRQAEFFATAMFVQLGYSLAAIPFVTIAAAVIVWGRADALSIVVALNTYILIFNQYEYFRRYFFAEGDRVKAFGFDVVLYTLLLSIILGFLNLGDMTIAAYLAISSVPAFIFCLLTLRKYKYRQTQSVVHIAHGRRIWRIASALIISTLAGFVSGHVFVYASALFLGAEEVGGIAAARNMMGPLAVLMMALENSMTREVVLLYRHSQASFVAYVNRTRIKWVIIFAAYAGLVALFAEDMLIVSYGEDFGQFYPLIYWMAAASIPQVLSRIQAIKLRTIGNMGAIRDANIVAMFIAFAVAPSAIYLFGLNGAGLSVFIVTNSIMVIQFLKDRPIVHIETCQ